MNDTITEINKDTFWGLIREAKDACGQDMSAMVEYLKGRLVSMGAEQAQTPARGPAPLSSHNPRR